MDEIIKASRTTRLTKKIEEKNLDKENWKSNSWKVWKIVSNQELDNQNISSASKNIAENTYPDNKKVITSFPHF